MCLAMYNNIKRKTKVLRVRTSYVTVPPEDDGCRRVTVETAPLADNTHIALGPCCEKAIIFVAMSYIVIALLERKQISFQTREPIKGNATTHDIMEQELNFIYRKQTKSRETIKIIYENIRMLHYYVDKHLIKGLENNSSPLEGSIQIKCV